MAYIEKTIVRSINNTLIISFFRLLFCKNLRLEFLKRTIFISMLSKLYLINLLFPIYHRCLNLKIYINNFSKYCRHPSAMFDAITANVVKKLHDVPKTSDHVLTLYKYKAGLKNFIVAE